MNGNSSSYMLRTIINDYKRLYSMNDYKLVVLDLDGTLTNNKKEITENTIATLREAQQRGVMIVLASGRPTYGIVPLAEQLCMEEYGGYILSFNGGEIRNWKTKEVLYESVLDNSLLPYLYQCSVDSGLPILSYEGESIITEYPDDIYIGKEAFLNKMKIKKVPSFLDAISSAVPKCLIVGEPSKLEVLEQKMYKEVGDRMGVYRSEPFFLELVPQGIDKAQSLAVLLEKTGHRRSEMIAIGDGFNDRSMIEFAGLGVAMANAQEQVKEVADYVTLSNEEDGVADVVNKFILSCRYPHN